MIVNSSPPHRAAVSVARSSVRITLGDFAQRVAARAVAVAIVDALEAVDIEKQQAERLAIAFGALDLGAQPRREPSRVEELREDIGLGQLGQLVRMPPEHVAKKGEDDGRGAADIHVSGTVGGNFGAQVAQRNVIFPAGEADAEQAGRRPRREHPGR